MRLTSIVLLASAMLFTGACAHSQVIPDPTIPHQVSREAEVRVWARQPDGKMVEQKIRLLKGWWVAGPPVVEASP
jgi:hypothetical protein